MKSMMPQLMQFVPDCGSGGSGDSGVDGAAGR